MAELANNSTDVDEDLSEPNLKKRRLSSENLLKSDVLASDGNDAPHLENLGEESEKKDSPEVELKQEMVPDKTAPKRKFVYNTAETVTKKRKKYHFITSSTTKPPKLKKICYGAETTPDANLVQQEPQKTHYAKYDESSNVCLMHRNYVNSDLFFNDEKRFNYEAFKKRDLAFHLVDEIALEGLDGITLEAYWKRLKVVFPNQLTTAVMNSIWKIICCNKQISFYVLQEPREELVCYDRLKYMDISAGVFVEPFVEVKDVYPMAIVTGKDVRGSCSTFETRKENNTIRRLTLNKALALYGQKLVLVADQTLRERAIFHEEADPCIELQDVEYALLERVGRSRTDGELITGPVSLQPIKNDAKFIYHNKKNLAANFLIVQQFFYLKSFTAQQNKTSGLLTLTRFYKKHRSKQVIIMEQMASYLRERGNNEVDFAEFRKVFNRNPSIVKTMKSPDFQKFFKVSVHPYRTVYPNASKKEWMRKVGNKEKLVRTIKLTDPAANVSAMLTPKSLATSVAPTTKQDEVPGGRLMNYDYLKDIFLFILSKGREGVTLQEIYHYMKVDFYMVRGAIRKLGIRNLIDFHKIDSGRQQCHKFFAMSFNNPSSEIVTEPKPRKLGNFAVLKALKGYEKPLDASIKMYSEAEVAKTPAPKSDFTLDFPPFQCNVFLTDIKSNEEELTIFDIINRGRDRLLLAESNLFLADIYEWRILQLNPAKFRSLSSFETELAKPICDFLSTAGVGSSLKTDNRILFNVNYLTTTNCKVCKISWTPNFLLAFDNYCNPHSDAGYIDFLGKTYLFEALLDEDHATNRTIVKLRGVNDRILVFEGKKKKKCRSDDEKKIQVKVSDVVVMEKFMGQDPSKVLSETNEEGITTEIFVSTLPGRFVEPGTLYVTKDPSITPRTVNRINLILKAVYSEKIVKETFDLSKLVRVEESREGYDEIACRKSIKSILEKLVKEGYIKIFKIVMRDNSSTRAHIFVCVPSITADHNLIRSRIDQLKLKFYIGAQSSNKKAIEVKTATESPFSSSEVQRSISELKELTNNRPGIPYKYHSQIGKTYGYSPKFVRLRILHEILYYLIHDFEDSQRLTLDESLALFKRFKVKIDENDVSAMPPVYCNEISWKMFIPPMPQLQNWPKGWSLACDVILRLPLSIFVKLHNVSYEIPELEEFLKHPVKRHFLIKCLPANLRNVLLHKRKYIFDISEMFNYLCYLGLMQLGPRSSKEKDQIFIYFNRKSSLYDTSTSERGYNVIEDKPYKKLVFCFKSSSDVELYWSEMWRISINTPLGKRKGMDGEFVTIEDCTIKPEMMQTLAAQSPAGAVKNDNGEIPGDRRGAAGLDSSLWTYLKRNWLWSGRLEKKFSKQSLTGLEKEKLNAELPRPIQFDLLKKPGQMDRKVYLNKLKPAKAPSAVVKVEQGKQKIVRKIVARKMKRAREYHDAIDKAIMKKNRQIRVDWGEHEDLFLRFCRVASLFLCPILKKQAIPYNVVRDVLHRIYPGSKNKTGKACQRRLYIMLLSDEDIKIMEANVENLLGSSVISRYFIQIHNRYRDKVKFSDSQLYVAFIYLMAYLMKNSKEMESLLLGHIATVDFFCDPYIFLFQQILEKKELEALDTTYTTPKTIEDVTKETIKSVVHCSLASKARWAYQLFQIYKKFPDYLIKIAVGELKKAQFLTMNKTAQRKNLGNWHWPLKFSYLYSLMKSSTYTMSMYSGAFEKLSAIIEKTLSGDDSFITYNEIWSFWGEFDVTFDVPEMAIILNPAIEDHNEVIEELAKRFRIYLIKIHENKKGEVCQKGDEDENGEVPEVSCKIEEPSSDQIQDDVMRLVFRVPYLIEGNLETYFKKMKESSDILEINNYVQLMIADLKSFVEKSIGEDEAKQELKIFVHNIEDECANQTKLIQNLSKIVFAIQNLEQHSDLSRLDDKFKLWESGESEIEVAKKEPNVEKITAVKNCGNAMDVCVKKALEGEFPSLDEIKEGMMVEGRSEGRQIPHITDLTMLLTKERFPELDTDEETIERWKEHFIMQYPRLQNFALRDVDEFKNSPLVTTLLLTDNKRELRKRVESYYVIKPPQMDAIDEYVQSENDPILVHDLIEFIKSKTQLGASAQEIKENFAEKPEMALVKLLKFLTSTRVILRAGVSFLVYVHFEYQSNWLIETFMLTSHEQEILDLNTKEETEKLKINLSKRLEETDLLKVQLMPWTRLDGTLNKELFEEWLCLILSHCCDYPNIPFTVLCKKNSFMKPVDIYYLVEILQELQCVEIYVYDELENSLFSSRAIVNEKPATTMDRLERMYIKTSSVAGLYFGSFLNCKLDF